MGNHPSSHQPLDRGMSQRNGLRLSKREKSPVKRMDRLRKSFRDSFRRRKGSVPESTRPHQWQADESAVKSATCTFNVKYLGCVEVFESRGMHVCEEALKVLRNSRRRPVRAILHVSGDGLRVVEDETKGLIVDQTIEKVSFCAPDRNHEHGFSYICRDGTARRWMCHGFLALKESGERLSHAVGCAFAACLERKQRRDKECGVTVAYDHKTSSFTRSGSFRQASLIERLQDAQERAVDVPPVKQVFNPFAIERPHATPLMLERQGSFRGFNQLNQASPFKRQLSLRVNDLPSNLERTRSHSLEPTDLSRMPALSHMVPIKPTVSPIPEISPSGQDSVSYMCQQVTRDLSLLSSTVDYEPIITATSTVKQLFSSTTTGTGSKSNSVDDVNLQNGIGLNNNTEDSSLKHMKWRDVSPVPSTNNRLTPLLNKTSCNLSPVLPRTKAIASVTVTTTAFTSNVSAFGTSTTTSPAFSTASTSSSSSIATPIPNRSPLPVNPITPQSISPNPSTTGPSVSPSLSATSEVNAATGTVPAVQSIQNVTSVQMVRPSTNLPKPEQWLGSITGSVTQSAEAPVPTPRRAPPLHARALSLGSGMSHTATRTGPSDPFDADWADIAARNLRQASTTNPFVVPNTAQAFQVQL